MPQISIIVPIYNSERYLRKCVDSLLNQTFRDFELILVNDGSKDSSPEICDGYARQDSRVRVLHQANQGQAAAKNNALELARGQWICFADSDDWMHPQMLELLYGAAMEKQVPVSVCGYALTQGEDPAVCDEDLKVTMWRPEDFYVQHYINATVPWGKLMRKDRLDGVRFVPGTYIDDEYFSYRVLFAQQALAVIPAPLYAYYLNPDSITKRAWNPRRLEAWDAYEQQIDYFTRRNMPEMVKYRYRHYLENGMVNLAGAEEDPETYRAQIRFIEKRMRSVIRRAWKAGEIRFWVDYDMLYRFYPLLTRVYRPILEWKVRQERKKQ